MDGSPKPRIKLAIAANTNKKKIFPAATLTSSPERRMEMPVKDKDAIIIPAMAQASPTWTTFFPVDSKASMIFFRYIRVFFLHQLTTQHYHAQKAESSVKT
jgi:hypothetical protein